MLTGFQQGNLKERGHFQDVGIEGGNMKMDLK